MEVVKKPSKVIETEIARWTINDFFNHINKKTATISYSMD
jgi:hypothetical protein